jgi:hypothetical protein
MAKTTFLFSKVGDFLFRKITKDDISDVQFLFKEYRYCGGMVMQLRYSTDLNQHFAENLVKIHSLW